MHSFPASLLLCCAGSFASKVTQSHCFTVGKLAIGSIFSALLIVPAVLMLLHYRIFIVGSQYDSMEYRRPFRHLQILPKLCFFLSLACWELRQQSQTCWKVLTTPHASGYERGILYLGLRDHRTFSFSVLPLKKQMPREHELHLHFALTHAPWWHLGNIEPPLLGRLGIGSVLACIGSVLAHSGSKLTLLVVGETQPAGIHAVVSRCL